MEAYKFDTTVLPNGVIKIPNNYHLENSEVEVVLTIKHKRAKSPMPKMTADDFFKKWAGVLQSSDIEEPKKEYYNYLEQKYK